LPPPRTSPRVFTLCVPARWAAIAATTTWCISGTFTGAEKTASGRSREPVFLPAASRTSMVAMLTLPS
jgi:hypothetical protein